MADGFVFAGKSFIGNSFLGDESVVVREFCYSCVPLYRHEECSQLEVGFSFTADQTDAVGEVDLGCGHVFTALCNQVISGIYHEELFTRAEA